MGTVARVISCCFLLNVEQNTFNRHSVCTGNNQRILAKIIKKTQPHMTHYTRYCSRTNERADFLRTMPVVGTFKTCVDVSQRRCLKNIFQAVGTKIENFVLIRFVTEIRHTHMLKYSSMGSRLNPHHPQWY